jgi:oxygen-dependent protoporphyrinogen oxidase
MPALSRVNRWPRGLPRYVIGHLERFARIDRHLDALPGMYLAGYAYRGVGIPDCVASGERAAENAVSFLTKEHLAPGVTTGVFDP